MATNFKSQTGSPGRIGVGLVGLYRSKTFSLPDYGLDQGASNPGCDILGRCG